jgi:hypothetical protein
MLYPRPEFSMFVLVGMDIIFGFIGRILLGFVLWVVLLPVTLIIAHFLFFIENRSCLALPGRVGRWS